MVPLPSFEHKIIWKLVTDKTKKDKFIYFEVAFTVRMNHNETIQHNVAYNIWIFKKSPQKGADGHRRVTVIVSF